MSGLTNAMNWLSGTLGKYLFAIPFAVFSSFHFMNAEAMAGMVPIPGGAIWVYVTGAGLLAAAISIVIGKKDKLATFLLGVLMLLTALTIHLPGVMEDSMNPVHMGNLLKDLALAGAAWMYSGSVGARDKS
jgi:putative oxidoreductase